MAASDGLQIVQLIDIIGGGLITASNIAEPDAGVGEATWSNATTYGLGARAILTSTHKLYESLQAGNTNNNPATSPTWWTEVSYTNKYRMFDQVNSSQSTRSGNIDVTITPNRVINSIALLNCVAQTIQIKQVEGATTRFDQTFDMQAPPAIGDYWNYFFDPIETKENLFVNLPSYGASATIQVIATVPSGSAAIGTMIVGAATVVGEGVQHGARVGIVDYSRKERNQWGDLVLVERSFSDRTSMTMLVPNGSRPAVKKLLRDNRAKPMLFIGVEGEEDTYVYGIYKDFEFIIEYPEHSVLTLDTEGLT